jgi:heme-degrading monooxygenase HmoA
MTTFKVVAIEFKENKYKSGEQEVNRNLSCGFEITKDFQTDSGVVIVMTKWEDEEDKKETVKNVDLRTFSEAKKEVDHK